MDIDRLKHSLAVARKMVEIAKRLNLTCIEQQDCFIIGYSHDIGYEFTKNGENHNIIGGQVLKNSNFKYWKEVYYHGKIPDEYSSIYLDILNIADMNIDKYGNDVGYIRRLDDIGKRYGTDSKVYMNCIELIRELKDKYMEEFKLNKEEVVSLVESLDIDFEEFWILSTSALVLRGLYDKANDLDICVTEKGLEQLKNKYNLIQKPNGWYIVKEDVECVLSKKENGKIEKLGKYNLQSLEDYYKYLDETKKEKDREKYKIVKKVLNK